MTLYCASHTVVLPAIWTRHKIRQYGIEAMLCKYAFIYWDTTFWVSSSDSSLNYRSFNINISLYVKSDFTTVLFWNRELLAKSRCHMTAPDTYVTVNSFTFIIIFLVANDNDYISTHSYCRLLHLEPLLLSMTTIRVIATVNGYY